MWISQVIFQLMYSTEGIGNERGRLSTTIMAIATQHWYHIDCHSF